MYDTSPFIYLSLYLFYTIISSYSANCITTLYVSFIFIIVYELHYIYNLNGFCTYYIELQDKKL